MAATYELKIITPQGLKYTGEVVHVRVPTENGSIGVLASHAPLITSSAGGDCLVREKGDTEKKFKVGSGFFSVAANQASFLTQAFENNE